MKIYGSLDRAQLEPLGANPTAGTAGRVWRNTADGKAYIDDGAANRALLVNDGKAVLGNSATAAENVRFHRGAAGVLQFVTGGDVTAEGTLSAALAQLSFAFEAYADGSKPTGVQGRAIFNTTFNALNIYNGSAWVAVGSGGGVGAYLALYPAPGGGPIEVEASDLIYWDFADGDGEEKLFGFLKVPDSYQAGQQIKLAISVESDEAGSAQLIMQAKSYLVRTGTDPITSVTNSNTDTASYSPAAIAMQELLLDLTDISGQINSLGVSKGDVLKIELSKPTDTSTENLRLFKSLVEVRIG